MATANVKGKSEGVGRRWRGVKGLDNVRSRSKMHSVLGLPPLGEQCEVARTQVGGRKVGTSGQIRKLCWERELGQKWVVDLVARLCKDTPLLGGVWAEWGIR